MLQLTVCLTSKTKSCNYLGHYGQLFKYELQKQNDIILKINTRFIYIRPPSIQNRTKLKYHKMSSNERVKAIVNPYSDDFDVPQ